MCLRWWEVRLTQTIHQELTVSLLYRASPKWAQIDGNMSWGRPKYQFTLTLILTRKLRFLARTYGLLGPVLPCDTQPSSHVDMKFSRGPVAKRGNVILPCDEMFDTRVSTRYDKSGESLFSVFVFDADYPDEQESNRFQKCLWAKYAMHDYSSNSIGWMSLRDRRKLLNSFLPTKT